MAWITCCAVTIETSCSTERLPKITPTTCLRPEEVAMEISSRERKCLSKNGCARRCQHDSPTGRKSTGNHHRQNTLAGLLAEQDCTGRLESRFGRTVSGHITRDVRG